MNDLHVVDAFDIHEGREDGGGYVFVYGDGHDIGAFISRCTYLHAIDVDAGGAEDGSNLADHARFVFMRRDDDAAFRFEVHAEVVEGNDFRFLAVEEGAGDAVAAFVGVDGEGNGIGEVVAFLGLHFADVHVTFLGDTAGVDEVHGLLQYRREEAFEDGGGERRGFCFCQFTGVLYIDGSDATAGEVDANISHTLAKIEIGLDHMEGGFGDGGRVHSGGYRFAAEGLGHADGYVCGYAGLGFLGGCAQVRGEGYIGHAKEWIVLRGQRFMGPHVDAGAGYLAGFESGGQGFDVYHRAAGCIDDADAVFHFFDFLGSDHTAGLIGERCVEGDVVGLAKKSFQVYQFHAQLFAALQGDVGVVADGLHVEGLQTFCHIGAHAADADDAHGFIQELDAGEALSVPTAFHDGLVGLGDVAGHGEHEGDGVLAGGDGIRFRCIHYGDALFRGFSDVDAVDPHAGAADDFEILGSVDDFLGDHRLASGDDGVVVTDDFTQRILLHVRLDVYDKFFFQNFFGFFGNVGSDENSHDRSPC